MDASAGLRSRKGVGVWFATAPADKPLPSRAWQGRGETIAPWSYTPPGGFRFGWAPGCRARIRNVGIPGHYPLPGLRAHTIVNLMKKSTKKSATKTLSKKTLSKKTLSKVTGGAARPGTSTLAKASAGRTAAPAKGVNLSAKR